MPVTCLQRVANISQRGRLKGGGGRGSTLFHPKVCLIVLPPFTLLAFRMNSGRRGRVGVGLGITCTFTGSVLLGRNVEQILGQIVSIRIKTLAIQIWWCQGMSKEKKFHFRLTCVAQKRRCLNSLMTSVILAQFVLLFLSRAMLRETLTEMDVKTN